MAAKLEWGVKRTCLACAARFYDMRRESIVCPKCGAGFDPEAVFRPRRARATETVAKPAAAPKKVAPAKKPKAEKVEDEADDATVKDDDEDGAVIEDTSDLGEDDDDLLEVREHIDGEERGSE